MRKFFKIKKLPLYFLTVFLFLVVSHLPAQENGSNNLEKFKHLEKRFDNLNHRLDVLENVIDDVLFKEY